MLWMKKGLLVRFPTFRLLLNRRKFGNELLVVAAHGALYGLVCLQTLQGLLRGAVVGVAEGLCKLLRAELLGQQSEALNELVCAAALLGGIAQLVVVVSTMQFVVPEMLGAVLDVEHQIYQRTVHVIRCISASLFALFPVAYINVGCAN